MKRIAPAIAVLVAIVAASCVTHAVAHDDAVKPPKGYIALFNGHDLDGWWGLSTEHYNKYRELSAQDFVKRQEESRKDIQQHWSVENHELVNDGHGLYLTTDKFYGDFELLVDYKTVAKADSGIYLRGIPQVQIWDFTEEGGKWNIGADKGSGGLWNNPKDWPGQGPERAGRQALRRVELVPHQDDR